MRVRLDYGRMGLEAEVPDERLARVLSLQNVPPLQDPQGAAAAALENPIGKPPLREVARGKRDACIVVCDITRPVPNPILLPPVLEALAAGGIPRERVTILIATGTHRPNLGAELDEMLGPGIAASVRVVNHVCTESEAMRSLGVSEGGVPIFLNKTYLDAEVKITIGMIEPHFMAGYAGGRKMVMPGIAALETVQAWHSPRFLEHPNATNGITDGNPVHEEALKIARLAPPDLILDVALDNLKRPCGVFCGDMEIAWNEGVRFVARNATATLPEPVDVVLTTCGGYPLDKTFYQAVKGMVGALPILKPGGTVVLAAECEEGVGQAHFERALLETTDIHRFPETIQEPGWTFVPDQWQIEELSRSPATPPSTSSAAASPRDRLPNLRRPVPHGRRSLGRGL